MLWYIALSHSTLASVLRNILLKLVKVFIGCPHRTRSLASLTDDFATLIYNTRNAPQFGLLETARLCANTLVHSNRLFLESNVPLRVQMASVFSQHLDRGKRVSRHISWLFFCPFRLVLVYTAIHKLVLSMVQIVWQMHIPQLCANTSQVFDEFTATLDFSCETRIGLPGLHSTMLCDDVEDMAYKPLQKILGMSREGNYLRPFCI